MGEENKEKSKRLTQLSILLLIIGLSLSCFAVIFLPKQTTPPARESFRSRGFVFKTTEMVDLNQSEFKMSFSEINCEEGSARCEILVNPFLNKSSEYSSAFFFLQIPYAARDVKIVFLTKPPEYFGGNTSIQVIDSLTYIMFDIPKEENYVVYNKRGTPTITFEFTVESISYQLDWYTYEMAITWGGSLHHASNNLNYLKNYNFYYSLHIFATQRSFLNIEKNEKYYYSDLLPSFERIGVWSNFTSYYWDLKALSSKGSESSIILELVNLDTKYKIDLRFSVVWLLSGIGVPLAFSSVVEIIKNGDLFRKKQFIESIGSWIVFGMVFVAILFSVLIHFLL